ncbi:Meiotic nuclear division protein 1, partial [Coemansia biformis]
RGMRFPYTRHHTILLVGEGNFSFARSVAAQLDSGANMIATSYDSREQACEKYPDTDEHVQEFELLGGTVLFGVDGTRLAKQKRLRGKQFSRIVFNFPHVGMGIKDQERNIRANQELLLGFFNSAGPLLTAGRPKAPPKKTDSDDSDDDDNEGGGGPRKKPRRRQRKGRADGPTTGVFVFEGIEAQVVYNADDGAGDGDDELAVEEDPGQIHVTLKSGMPYERWSIRRLARDCGLVSHTTLPFTPSTFPGYEHRRTLGFEEGVSKDANKEICDKRPKLYTFVTDPQEEPSSSTEMDPLNGIRRETPLGPRLNLDEKRKRMLDIFHESQEPFLLKELERIGPKQKGIVAQSVKDVVQSLVDDGLCHCEKVGTSNFFWAFPSEAAVKRQNKKRALEKELAQAQATKEELTESIARAQLGREQTEERANLVEELGGVEATWKEQQAELQKFKECDPAVLNQKRNEAREARDAANRWTDNIFIIQSWVREKFNMDMDDFNKHFGIPADLDSV